MQNNILRGVFPVIPTLFTNDNKQKNMLKVESTELQLTVHQGLTTNDLPMTYQLLTNYELFTLLSRASLSAFSCSSAGG